MPYFFREIDAGSVRMRCCGQSTFGVRIRVNNWKLAILGAFWLAASGNAGDRVSLREMRRNHLLMDMTRDEDGVVRGFRAGVVLARFKQAQGTEAIVVPRGSEEASLRKLRERSDIAFAELDFVLQRQFEPNDPAWEQQWHHQTIHSADAWSVSLATHKVTVAILDTPFQMNHPDLVANAVSGWDMVTGKSITAAPEGYYHSTLGAGMAAAVINNSTGVSGVANCWLMPVNIGDNPTTSDMHDAVVWAADHGARVVNLSWDGAFSSVINEAGAYLKEKMRGMLFMAGVNGRKFLNYPKQPDIYAVAMTDQQDQPRSAYGDHIDFSAPGWQIYSTTTNSTYEVDSGTSYSAPLVAGIAAWVMSVNPDLGPAEIEAILREGAADLGVAGWDQTFGWGRIDFGQVAKSTFATLPISRISLLRFAPPTVSAVYETGAHYRLFRSPNIEKPVWEWVTNAQTEVEGGVITLSDPSAGARAAFYQVEITRARD